MEFPCLKLSNSGLSFYDTVVFSFAKIIAGFLHWSVSKVTKISTTLIEE